MFETSAVSRRRIARLLSFFCFPIPLDPPALHSVRDTHRSETAYKGSVRRIFWRFSAFVAIAAGSVAHAGPLVTAGANFSGCNIHTCPAIPPDTNGAIGPDQFVELLNGGYSVYNKSGMLIQRSSLSDFWSSAGVTPLGPFDPRVLYDSTSQHWFASSANN